jgi:AraC-like DNA-binding protein
VYHGEITQKTISFIENNLTEDIQLNHFPTVIGYSKFHLLRIFKQETGMSIGEYIRIRRLADSARLLLFSNQSILSIAFLFHFQSQEAFTCSFKEVYALPPGKYRKFMKTMLVTKEHKSMNPHEEVKGWSLSGSHPELYEMKTDDKVFHTGKRAGFLAAKGEANKQQFATMMQGFQAEEFRGKRLKMSCFLKTEEVFKCGAWLRMDDASGDTVQFDNMDNRSIKGSTEWNHYAIVLDVPDNANSIYFGVLLIGQEKVRTDGFCFEEVSEKVPTTNLIEQEHLPLQPRNLDFGE